MQNMMDVFTGVIRKLEEANIPYMVVGSIASMVYGEPRMTHDLDLVIDLMAGKVGEMTNLFPSTDFYCPPLEIIAAEVGERGQFNLLHHHTGLKIDVMIRKQTEHAITEFGRRRRIRIWKDTTVFLAAPEDVILKKLTFYREGGSEKHLRDIRGILAHTKVDDAYLIEWIKKLRLEEEWQRVN